MNITYKIPLYFYDNEPVLNNHSSRTPLHKKFSNYPNRNQPPHIPKPQSNPTITQKKSRTTPQRPPNHPPLPRTGQLSQ